MTRRWKPSEIHRKEHEQSRKVRPDLFLAPPWKPNDHQEDQHIQNDANYRNLSKILSSVLKTDAL
jgi:hypothetical protein